MGRGFLMGVGNSGGGSSEECTAKKKQVLRGVTAITQDSENEPAEGTMPDLSNESEITHQTGNITPVLLCDKILDSVNTDGVQRIQFRYMEEAGYLRPNTLFGMPANEVRTYLTSSANATENDILEGKTGYVNGKLVVGKLKVQSAINFNIAAVSYNSVKISWTNPSKGPWNGVAIQMSTSGYPGTDGGTRVFTNRGTSASPGAVSEAIISGLSPNVTYYFTCTSFAEPLPWGQSVNLSCKTPDSRYYLASSQTATWYTFYTFTVDDRTKLHYYIQNISNGNTDRRKWRFGRAGDYDQDSIFSTDWPGASSSIEIPGDDEISGVLDFSAYKGKQIILKLAPASDNDHGTLTIHWIYLDTV